MANYRIAAVPVYVNGHLYDRPEDIGRAIQAPEGLAGTALVEVVAQAADEKPPRSTKPAAPSTK